MRVEMRTRLGLVSTVVATALFLAGITGGALGCDPPPYSLVVGADPPALYHDGRTSTVTAHVTIGDLPVEGHSIGFSLGGPGSIYPTTGNTDSWGNATTTYTSANDGTGTATITATDWTQEGHPSAQCTVTVFKITKNQEQLWWFNGETPDGYATEYTLTAIGSSTGSFSWGISQGFEKAGFVSGANVVQTVTIPNSNTVNMRSKGASEAVNDVHFDFWWNSIHVITLTETVRAPHHLDARSDLNPDDHAYYNGYISYIHYRIKDQFAEQLPSTVPANEAWIDPPHYPDGEDWVGETWPLPQVEGSPVSPADMYDRIWISGVYYPSVQNPEAPLGDEKVDHWGQRWRVGSSTSGYGVQVKDDILQRYRDHGVHR